MAGFWQAFHSHIEDLAYEMLKDPEYQEWMDNWLDQFARIWSRKRRERGNGRRGGAR